MATDDITTPVRTLSQQEIADLINSMIRRLSLQDVQQASRHSERIPVILSAAKDLSPDGDPSLREGVTARSM